MSQFVKHLFPCNEEEKQLQLKCPLLRGGEASFAIRFGTRPKDELIERLLSELDKKDQGGGTHSEEGGGAAAEEDDDEEEEDAPNQKTEKFFDLEEEGFRAYQGLLRRCSAIHSLYCGDLGIKFEYTARTMIKPQGRGLPESMQIVARTTSSNAQ